MYKYLFGPVPSRRLGMSLGVDLVPKKVCSLDCVYCEVGKTTKLTSQRMEYIPYEKITSELKDFFKNHPDPDYITLSGSGEPTLNIRFGEVLQYIRQLKPEIPVAVLTNGTLLHHDQVRKELSAANVVLPSLDAATEPVFKKINRPASDLSLEEHIQGLADFRKMFSGEIWLEVLILPGYNDHQEELDALKQAIRQIQPDKVQLNTLDRPGVEDKLTSASVQHLRKIQKNWNLNNVEIIAKPKQRKSIASYGKDTETAILETIKRRPCTAEDLCSVLGLHINEVNKYLDVLEADNKIHHIKQGRGIFYRVA